MKSSGIGRGLGSGGKSMLTIPELLGNDAGEIELLKEFASEYRDQLPSRHEIDVARTFEMSWNIASDRAKEILRVLGELAPVPVPRTLLRLVLNLPRLGGTRDLLEKRLAELRRLSLAESTATGIRLRIG
jgi:hypothetical protein